MAQGGSSTVKVKVKDDPNPSTVGKGSEPKSQIRALDSPLKWKEGGKLPLETKIMDSPMGDNGISQERGGEGGKHGDGRQPIIAAGGFSSGSSRAPKTQLMLQKVKCKSGTDAIVMWDTGAQVSLITHEFARKSGLRYRKSDLQISGIGKNNRTDAGIQYRLPLQTKDGKIVEVTPYGMTNIAGGSRAVCLAKAKQYFPRVQDQLESPVGRIDVLIGMDFFSYAPKEVDRRRGMILYLSLIHI